MQDKANEIPTKTRQYIIIQDHIRQSKATQDKTRQPNIIQDKAI